MFSTVRNRQLKLSRQPHQGFTLIELLIVVAIIAILAAIAVPNFLEAQTRSKVSRVKADLKSIAVAMESYYIDNNGYPAGWRVSPLGSAPSNYGDNRLLTTPIQYMTSVPLDIFVVPLAQPYRLAAVRENELLTFGSADYWTYPRNTWMTYSHGPDNDADTGGFMLEQWVWEFEDTGQAVQGRYRGPRYDATNGTVSNGDIYQFRYGK